MATAKPERPVNPRLAHLLPPAAVPSGVSPAEAGSDRETTTILARLTRSENEVATLTALLDKLEALADSFEAGTGTLALGRAVGSRRAITG